MKLFNQTDRHLLRQRMLESDEKRTTLSFYQYSNISDPANFRDQLYLKLDAFQVLGRIYVSSEGVNAQVSIPTDLLDVFRKELRNTPHLNRCRLNLAIDDNGKSFIKLKVKVRKKIVADGLDDDTFDVTRRGTPLSAAAYNQLADQADTIVVDMRNHYESEVGYFENALRPEVSTFREALPLVEKMLADKKDRNIVMYCTGGIRCEKATAYYLHKGFRNVFMVDGGIIEYARQCREQGLPNKFIGKNFVFDERLGERISEDVVAKCHQCGTPCDRHANCANDACHLLFIQCETCAEKYRHCCSSHCVDFLQLPEEIRKELLHTAVFNGSKFSKDTYRSYRREQGRLSD
jgi:UPF0176 protein